MIRDTVLMVLASSIILILLVVVIWDWRRSMLGKTTISDIARSFYRRNRERFVPGLLVGLLVGGIVMFIVGFIMGHLFFPYIGD